MTIKGIIKKQISILLSLDNFSLIYMDHLFLLNETTTNPAKVLCIIQHANHSSKLIYRSWREGSAVKSACCYSRGSQACFPALKSRDLQLPVTSGYSVLPSGLRRFCTHTHIPTNRPTCIYSVKNN